ncbi:unnamed protein product [Leptidea sinapis]|uniref:Protein kinase domain-containing protein n=1 Tax=Leptidea sinapis TaxID=189913 RepID=A0A5E4PSG5_9NEOP|nr:unnamed protein product [Leptidea sinapis]
MRTTSPPVSPYRTIQMSPNKNKNEFAKSEMRLGVGHGSSRSGSERECEEVVLGSDSSAPVPIPDSEDLQRRKEEARRKRRRKKRSGSSVVTSCFQVKIIDKVPGHARARVFREVETFHYCQGHPNIIQLIEFFEDTDKFYLVFEKINGGQLLARIQEFHYFSEPQAAQIVREIANALHFLHGKGVAHRDLKPENILCVHRDRLCPVKVCDFDLGSGISFTSTLAGPLATPQLMTPVVCLFAGSAATSYDKRCDLWSLGVIAYILLCGYPPFRANCGRDCGWEGRYTFPEEEWSEISSEAKDLIRQLLVREASHRLSAERVLNHPWLQCADPDHPNQYPPLQTPLNIKRNMSARNLSNFAESAMAVNRVIQQHFSMNYSYMERPPALRCTKSCQPSPPQLIEEVEGAGVAMQKMAIGNRCVDDGLPFGLSPPTESQLLRRRLQTEKPLPVH